MARTGNKTSTKTSANVEAPTTEEVPVTTTEAAPEAVTVPATPAAPAPVADEQVVDITSFTGAAQAAIDGASDRGELSEDQSTAALTAYRGLTGTKNKAAARAWVNDLMTEAMKTDEFITAKAAFELHKSLNSAKEAAPKKEKAPVDPTEVFVSNIVAVQLGFGLLRESAPEGVSDDWRDKAKAKADSLGEQVATYGTWLTGAEDTRGEAPAVDPIVLAAYKIARTKASKGAKASGGGSSYVGKPRSIQTHIAEAFADVAPGTFLKISEIVNHKSSEYGDDNPSQGAVAAALKSPKFSVEGVTPSQDASGKKGATKS